MQTVFATAIAWSSDQSSTEQGWQPFESLVLGCFEKVKVSKSYLTHFFILEIEVPTKFFSTISTLNFLFPFSGKNLDFFPINEDHDREL